MIFPRLVLILLVICLMPSGVHAGGLRAGRITRLADSQLRDRLASASITRGEPVEVISRSPEPEGAAETDHFNAGMALYMTGRFTLAAEAFERAVASSEPGSQVRSKAIEQLLRISEFIPDLGLSQLIDESEKVSEPDISLYLSGYLAARGQSENALGILKGASIEDADRKVVTAILTASALAATEGWDASADHIGRVRVSETSPLVDLLYLMRGYHYLQSGQPERARSSFAAIFPSSPYAPEALLGKAWSLNQTGDLKGATIVLEELVERHPYSHAAGDGVLDLALSYRELGLYEKAGQVLDHHVRRLGEVRSWLLGLQREDLQTGGRPITLLKNALDGSVTEREALLQTPYFVRQWVMDISTDPYVRRLTALLEGVDLTGEWANGLSRRLDRDRELIRREIKQTKEDISRARRTTARLGELRDNLRSVNGVMGTTLQSQSLGGFASQAVRRLLSRTAELKLRLSLMESSVSKAEGFTSLVSRLSESVTISEEENQLNQIRKHAYDGLITSRTTLRKLRNTLTALEGRLWLDVKSGAVELERKTSERVDAGRARALMTLDKTSRAVNILSSRLQALEEFEIMVTGRKRDLETTYSEKFGALRQRIEGMRAERLRHLASETTEKIREAEARALYTSADIEISRMEDTVRSLQEAVQ